MSTRAQSFPASASYTISEPQSWVPRRIARAVLLVLVLAAIPFESVNAKDTGGSSAAVIIYVSPSGNDANPGTEIAPFRTLAHAQQVVRSLNRNMTANISVYLEDGTYRLTRPLQFGPLDSGTNGYDVIWTAAPGATAIISGAERISGWRLSNPSKHIWVAAVPRTLQTRQIYVNGTRATLTLGRAPVKLSRVWNGYSASSSLMSRWRNPSQIDFVFSGQIGLMAEPICPVSAIGAGGIAIAQPCWDNSTKRIAGGDFVGYGSLGSPSYIENAYELLNQPGQFYLDNTAHRLYYIPRADDDMATADVEAPALQTLLEGNGSARAPIHNITFANLQFSYATWLQPSTPTGFSEVQAGYTITGSHGYATEGVCHYAPHGTCPFGAWTKEPGNVQFSYDRDLTFANDRFVHLGAAGLNLDNGTQAAAITGSVFTDISGNGVEIGSVNKPRATGSVQTKDVTLANNHIYGVGVEYHGGVAVLVGYVSHSTITHNQIDHVPYAGISLGWGGWPDKTDEAVVSNNSRDDVISDNVIEDFMQTLTDGGGIYTQGITGTSMANGEKISGNVVHDQLDWGFALHSDDGASYITYASNVLYNDTYDWGISHYNFNGHGGLDPLLLEHNYWQQGDLNAGSYWAPSHANKIITGPEQVPPALLANAGIQPAFQSILSWRAPGESVPNPPQLVHVLFAFRGEAYVTWRPSYATVNGPVTSYTVTACRVQSIAQTECTRSAVPPVTISASAYDQLGYAVIHGLTDGKGYDFMVTAQSDDGSSTPSIPSTIVKPGSRASRLPRKPTEVVPHAGHGCVSLQWYPPHGVVTRPALAYVVTSSTHQTYTFTGLEQLNLSDGGGKVLHVIGGLLGGHRYRFSIAAVTPAGTGPGALSHWIRPR